MDRRQNDAISCLDSPLKLFCSLLLLIFCVELLIMFVILPLLYGSTEGVVASLTDSLLLTLLSAPYIWMRIVRPLRITAMQEMAWTGTLLVHVVDGVVVVSKECVVESANAAAEAIFGYRPGEMTGLGMKSLLEELNALKEKCGAGSKTNCEATGRRRDGVLFPVDLSVSEAVVRDRPMFICIIRDITERKRAEENIRKLNMELASKVAELLEAQEELVRRERLAMLGQLAGSIGHELRNPLGVMNNAVFFLRSVLKDAGESVGEYLDIIGSEIDNSQRIITDLLDFVRISPPRVESTMVEELILESLGRCVIPDKVTVRADIGGNLPSLSVDPKQMGQVMKNLIVNAVQAMPDGGVLCIKARRRGLGTGDRGLENNPIPISQSPIPDAYIEISVSDTGKGIEAENLARLFQPLFTTKARGIGLGLATSKNLIEANGGRIEVVSRPGEGSTFTAILPAEREEVSS